MSITRCFILNCQTSRIWFAKLVSNRTITTAHLLNLWQKKISLKMALKLWSRRFKSEISLFSPPWIWIFLLRKHLLELSTLMNMICSQSFFPLDDNLEMNTEGIKTWITPVETKISKNTSILDQMILNKNTESKWKRSLLKLQKLRINKSNSNSFFLKASGLLNLDQKDPQLLSLKMNLHLTHDHKDQTTIILTWNKEDLMNFLLKTRQNTSFMKSKTKSLKKKNSMTKWQD